MNGLRGKLLFWNRKTLNGVMCYGANGIILSDEVTYNISGRRWKLTIYYLGSGQIGGTGWIPKVSHCRVWDGKEFRKIP